MTTKIPWTVQQTTLIKQLAKYLDKVGLAVVPSEPTEKMLEAFVSILEVARPGSLLEKKLSGWTPTYRSLSINAQNNLLNAVRATVEEGTWRQRQ